jgi:hypothetical protein
MGQKCLRPRWASPNRPAFPRANLATPSSTRQGREKQTGSSSGRVLGRSLLGAILPEKEFIRRAAGVASWANPGCRCGATSAARRFPFMDTARLAFATKVFRPGKEHVVAVRRIAGTLRNTYGPSRHDLARGLGHAQFTVPRITSQTPPRTVVDCRMLHRVAGGCL